MIDAFCRASVHARQLQHALGALTQPPEPGMITFMFCLPPSFHKMLM